MESPWITSKDNVAEFSKINSLMEALQGIWSFRIGIEESLKTGSEKLGPKKLEEFFEQYALTSGNDSLDRVSRHLRENIGQALVGGVITYIADCTDRQIALISKALAIILEQRIDGRD